MRRCPLISIVVLLGCSFFEEPPPPPTPLPVREPAPIAAARPIATRASFDLVSGPAGTFVAWGVPADDGAGVRILELGPGGAARGSESDISAGSAVAPGSTDQAPSQTLELAMAASGDHLGIAWSVVVRDEIRVEAAYAATPPAFAPAMDLGDMERGGPGTGNLSVAALGDGGIYVAHRISRGPCHDAETGATECTRFSRTRIPEGDGVRGDGASVIATPCTPLLPGTVGGASGEPWFYGVCHGETPATTVFVINPDPATQYAAAAEVLAGCTPVSMSRGDSGAVLRARCGDDEALARIDTMGRVTRELRHAVLTTRCDAGRPVLEARDGDAALVRRLTESESRIEAWLPASIAPEGARAVWTGEALLVAIPMGPDAAREVGFRRYECVGTDLARTDQR